MRGEERRLSQSRLLSSEPMTLPRLCSGMETWEPRPCPHGAREHLEAEREGTCPPTRVL